MGEGFLPQIKSLIHSMHQTDSKCTLQSHMPSRHYSEIIKSLNEEIKLTNKVTTITIANLLQSSQLLIPNGLSANGGDIAVDNNVSSANSATSFQTVNGSMEDKDGSNVKPISSSVLPNIIHKHNQRVVPVICDIPTGCMYIVARSKHQEEKLILCHPCIDEHEILFGALYVHYEFEKKDYPPARILQTKNVLTAVLLQHPNKSKYYYAIPSDWKELICGSNVQENFVFEFPLHIRETVN